MWRRALIVGHGHIGDVLCQTVSLDFLARILPECRFDYLTTPLAAQVLSGNPALAQVLPWNIEPRPGSLSPEHVTQLRMSQYDAILCTNIVRQQEALGLALSLRIPNRVAFVHRGLSGLVTLPVRLPHPLPAAVESRAMAETICAARDISELRPRVFLAPRHLAEADTEMRRLGLSGNELVVTCSVTTRQKLGNVPEEFFVDTLGRLLEMAPQAKVVLTGSQDDAAVLGNVAACLKDSVLISAGPLPLLAFAAFLARSSVHFCMDSGPRHIANAVGTPVVFVRNLAVRAEEAGRYCDSEADVMPDRNYLSDDEIRRVLSETDRSAVARVILDHARKQHRGSVGRAGGASQSVSRS
jgi:ADP-heptose:LPS heptosyltransferase